MSLIDSLEKTIKDHSQFPCLEVYGNIFSYKDLGNAFKNRVAELKRFNYAPGTILCSSMPNNFKTLVDFLSCLKLRLVWAPIFHRKSSHEITTHTLMLNERRLACGSSGVIFSTSGSTGEPKYIFQSSENLYQNALISAQRQGIGPESSGFSSLTLSHTGGMNMQALPLILSGGKQCWEERFIPSKVLKILQQVDYAVIVPSQLEALIRDKSWENFTMKRTLQILTGSMPVGKKYFDELEAKKIKLLSVYGLTEIGPFVATTTQWTAPPQGALCELGSVLPMYHFRLDEEGEIYLRGPCMGKYVKNPSSPSVSELVLNEVSEIPTGDLGVQVQERLFFKGRKKRTINSSGMKFSPEEVEIVLKSHPKVEEAYIQKVKSSRFGEAAEAYIQGSVSKSELRSFLRKKLSYYKIPRTFHLLTKIEKSDIDKPRVLKSSE